MSHKQTHFAGSVEAGYGVKMPDAVDYSADGAIDVDNVYATLSKGSAGAMTLAAPGTDRVGEMILILAASAQAHVITAASVDGGNTLTFGGAIGDNIRLFARSSTAWSILTATNVTLSTL